MAQTPYDTVQPPSCHQSLIEVLTDRFPEGGPPAGPQQERKRMARIIGIDLGTTNSEAAVMEGGKPRIIPSAEGNVYGGKNFPSYIASSKESGEILVGDATNSQAVRNPTPPGPPPAPPWASWPAKKSTRLPS